MATTANGLPYPVGTDKVVDGDNAIKALAEALDVLLLRAWKPYVPIVGGLTMGNATIVGRYWKLGRTVSAVALLTFGSTTVLTGGISISLPAPPASPYSDQVASLGTGLSLNGGIFTPVFPAPVSSTAVIFRVANGSTVSAGIPGVWTAGSQLSMNVTYEAAA